MLTPLRSEKSYELIFPHPNVLKSLRRSPNPSLFPEPPETCSQALLWFSTFCVIHVNI